MSAGFKELVSNLQGNFTLIAVVLCQEKVQVKSELFLQPSIFYPANLSILFNFCSYTFSYSFGDRYPQ